jgi:hypothetical protein
MGNDSSDLGKKVDKNGAGSGDAQLTTAYTPGDVFNAGRSNLVLWVEVDAGAVTNLTSVQIKLQASYAGSGWQDVGLIPLDATSITTAAVAASLNAVAGSMVVGAFRTEAHRGLNFQRVLAKATAGGSLAAGDAVRVYAKAA